MTDPAATAAITAADAAVAAAAFGIAALDRIDPSRGLSNTYMQCHLRIEAMPFRNPNTKNLM